MLDIYEFCQNLVKYDIYRIPPWSGFKNFATCKHYLHFNLQILIKKKINDATKCVVPSTGVDTYIQSCCIKKTHRCKPSKSRIVMFNEHTLYGWQ